MSTVLFRQRVAATMLQAQADWTGAAFDVEYENQVQINPDTQVNPFIQFDIYYIDGEQKDLSDKPLVASVGQLVLSIAVKQGSGTKFAETLREFLSPYFELKGWSEGVLSAAEPQRTRTLGNWVYFPVLFNCTVYRHTSQ